MGSCPSSAARRFDPAVLVLVFRPVLRRRSSKTTVPRPSRSDLPAATSSGRTGSGLVPVEWLEPLENQDVRAQYYSRNRRHVLGRLLLHLRMRVYGKEESWKQSHICIQQSAQAYVRADNGLLFGKSQSVRL